MDVVKRRFVSVFKKTGIALDGRHLLSWARRKRLQVTAAQVHEFLRESADPVLGSFARATPVAAYQTISPLRPGVFFLDYGAFHKSWSGYNDGATDFLVAVENVSCRLWVVPTRGKGTQQWLTSIAEFVANSGQVSVIYSDRDTVAKSRKFRQQLFNDYGIRWHFLRSRHKSFLAERFVGYVKRKLSVALERAKARQADDQQPVKRWVDYIKPLLKLYNSQLVEGTTIRRRSVTRENFNQLLRQLFNNNPNYDLLFNSYSFGEFAHKPEWNRRIFKYSLGDRVRVNRRADWADPENRLGFAKPSTRGSYGKKIYPIIGRQLRSNKARTRYIPVYALGDLPEGSGYTFYEEDLVRVVDHSRKKQ